MTKIIFFCIADFPSIIRNIFKRLFRIYAHVYYEHFKFIQDSNFLTFVNESFIRFFRLTDEFRLVEENDMKPLADLIAKLKSEKMS